MKMYIGRADAIMLKGLLSKYGQEAIEAVVDDLSITKEDCHLLIKELDKTPNLAELMIERLDHELEYGKW